jgi:hypothetical protein
MIIRSTIKPEVIEGRILRLKAELRRLKLELQLAKAAERDRDSLEKSQQEHSNGK